MTFNSLNQLNRFNIWNHLIQPLTVELSFIGLKKSLKVHQVKQDQLP